MNTAETDYVTATEAARLLDVSKGKMAKLLSSGEISHISDPRNERAKLVRRSDIDAWLAKAPRPKVPHRRLPKQPHGEQQPAKKNSQDSWGASEKNSQTEASSHRTTSFLTKKSNGEHA